MFDLSAIELHEHHSDVTPPDDLESFWAATLAEARTSDPVLSITPVRCGLDALDVYDVVFRGFGGDPIAAWLIRPTAIRAPLPCVLEFAGYGGGRGNPWEWLFWPAAGYASLVMDTRGQGAGFRSGVTPDRWPAAGPHTDGFLTLGITDPRDYYYRRVYTDAVRALDAARTLPQVDPGRIAVAGGSQGGGIALAVAALGDDVSAALIDVPFLCDVRRAVGLVDTEPYAQIARYLRVHVDQVACAFRTLSYFDGTVLARAASAPALFAASLMDNVCPPSTVFAAVNAYGGPSKVIEYAYNKHDVPAAHRAEQLTFLARQFG